MYRRKIPTEIELIRNQIESLAGVKKLIEDKTYVAIYMKDFYNEYKLAKAFLKLAISDKYFSKLQNSYSVDQIYQINTLGKPIEFNFVITCKVESEIIKETFTLNKTNFWEKYKKDKEDYVELLKYNSKHGKRTPSSSNPWSVFKLTKVDKTWILNVKFHMVENSEETLNKYTSDYTK